MGGVVSTPLPFPLLGYHAWGGGGGVGGVCRVDNSGGVEIFRRGGEMNIMVSVLHCQ